MTANQIAFYPKSSGGGSGSSTLIAEVTLGAPAANVTFSAIPQTYKHLQIIFQASSDFGSVDSISMTFNGDAGGNYNTQFVYGNASTAAAAQANAADNILLGNLSGAGSSGDASPGNVSIPNYTGTAFNKGVNAHVGSSATSGNMFDMLCSGVWRSTAAITSISLFSINAANFVAGSTFSLYGLS